MNDLLLPISEFLRCETPTAWLDAALENQAIMLIDHCNCEKKAANTAISLIFRYTERRELLLKMSKLAREELRHFEQVLAIMQKRDIQYRNLSASRYAGQLFKKASNEEPKALVDRLIIGALIEARSCERFAKIALLLDDELGQFYHSLLKSESRHFKDYLKLARDYADGPIEQRVSYFLQRESELIQSKDTEFRFHSGAPDF